LSGPTKSRSFCARVDDREMDALREERKRVREHERALQHAVPRDSVRNVDDLRLGRDPLDDAVAGADEVVLEPEVGQERDEHRVSATLPQAQLAVPLQDVRAPRVRPSELTGRSIWSSPRRTEHRFDEAL
jgi:hypothetical protein